jgi:hypothetical protein
MYHLRAGDLKRGENLKELREQARLQQAPHRESSERAGAAAQRDDRDAARPLGEFRKESGAPLAAALRPSVEGSALPEDDDVPCQRHDPHVDVCIH